MNETNKRAKQYAVILAETGDAVSVGFRFQDTKRVASFHYGLMREGAKYLIFDGCEAYAIVTARRASMEHIRAVAEQYGGSKYTPRI